MSAIAISLGSTAGDILTRWHFASSAVIHGKRSTFEQDAAIRIENGPYPMDMNSYIAATRFGFGVALDAPTAPNAASALIGQSRYRPPSPSLMKSEAIVAEYIGFQKQARSAAAMGDVLPPEKRAAFNQAFRGAVADRVERSVTSERPFYERLVQFWSNHFAIDAKTIILKSLVPDYEMTAIAPYVGGRFADMLSAALLHPAMLIYLDQVNSIGPNSIAGQRGKKARAAKGKKAGLNENLAREILELHTLGVDGGYTQADIEELARAMTGHTIAHYSRGRDAMMASEGRPIGRVLFIPELHEPGPRRVLGRTYVDSGHRQFLAILNDIALHPSTARFLARKLARHFIADEPPPALVKTMADAYLQSSGELAALYSAMLNAPEAWQARPQKFKSPWDWTISACRLLGDNAHQRLNAMKFIEDLGQKIWQPGSPAGFGDTFADWASPDGLVRRMGAAERLAGRSRNAALDAGQLDFALPPAITSAQSRAAVLAAESPSLQWAIMLSLPEFQRR